MCIGLPQAPPAARKRPVLTCPLVSPRKGLVSLCAVLALGAGTRLARADHPTSGFGSALGGPVVTIPPTTLPRGTWAVGIRTEYVRFNPIPDPELRNFAYLGEEVHSVRQ